MHYVLLICNILFVVNIVFLLNKMYDLVTIGGVTIDLFFKGVNLTVKNKRFFLAQGGKYTVDTFLENVGGGGANVAIGCSHYSLDVAVLAKIGENAFKQIILQKLVKKNVSTEFLLYEKEFINISSILLGKSSEKTVIHYLTPHDSFALSPILMNRLLNTRAVYMGNLPNISLDEKVHLLDYIKKAGKIIFLNLSRKDCQRGIDFVNPLLKRADFFIINTHEYAELVGKKHESINFKKNCLKAFKNPIFTLVLTAGENGSYSYRDEIVTHIPALKVSQIIDSSGAGDGYCAGFIAETLNNASLVEAMEEVSRYAKKILEKLGAN